MCEWENEERSYHKSAYKTASALDALLKESHLICCVMQSIVMLSEVPGRGNALNLLPLITCDKKNFEEQCKIWGVLGIEQPHFTIFPLYIFLWQGIEVVTTKWMKEFGAFSMLSSISLLLTSLMLHLFLGCLSLIQQFEVTAQTSLIVNRKLPM